MSAISYVNALAGAGKTRAMARQAHSAAAGGEAVLLVLPTLDLIRQVEADLSSLSPAVSVDAIHSGVTESVIPATLKALKLGPQNGRVLIITWAAFLRLLFIQNRQAWTVFIDEIPQVCFVRE